MTHHCHAVDCPLRIPPRLLFCSRHWFMVPKPLQRLVWKVYKPGQEVRKDPSAAYMVVQGLAVAHVAWKEGRWTAQYRDDFAQAKLLRWGPRMTPQEFQLVMGFLQE